mmetsp:Transcript_45538/g.134819  ORF Transcript_45538/g.134819 Transcript_45538/m.134819 type:complete len:169 (+) Transcript_45538:101-607(+)
MRCLRAAALLAAVSPVAAILAGGRGGLLEVPQEVIEQADYWKQTAWHDPDGCGLPRTHLPETAAAVERACGDGSGQAHNRCECMIAKAHSCYLLCKEHVGGGEAMNAEWETCMANCYPTPSCTSMCQHGTANCEAGCVEKYRDVVDPFKEMFEVTAAAAAEPAATAAA